MVDGSDNQSDGERLEAVALREQTQHGEAGQDPEHHQQQRVVNGSY